VNILGTPAQTIVDRQSIGMEAIAGFGGDAAAALATMLEALTDDLLTSEFMCRMCDELACPDDRCPVERAEPAPTERRGTGYGVR
jgi:hypothetical protein